MTKKSGTKKQKRVALVIILAFIGLVATPAVLIGAQKAYDYREEYRNRPLTEGYEYIGRDYRNPCLLNYMAIGMWCFVAETDNYYFATDDDPATLINNFPGWEMGASGETESKLWKQPNIFTPIHYYNSHNTYDLAQVYYESYSDTQLIIKNSQLQQNNKKYIILISREDYKKLINASDD